MTLTGWFVVILVTSGMLFTIFGWLLGQGRGELERMRLLDQLDEVTDKLLDRANDDMLPHAGRLGYQGAQDPGYQLAPIPWDLAGAAYVLGQIRADQDDATREVNAIFAEIEGNPAKWRHG